MDPFCYLCFMSGMLYSRLFAAFVVTCWERGGLLVLLCVMFSCIIVTFQCGAVGQL